MIVNENTPGVLGAITTACGTARLNIQQTVNTSRGDIAYNVVDFSDDMVWRHSQIYALTEHMFGCMPDQTARAGGRTVLCRAHTRCGCQENSDYEGLQDSIQALDGVISSRILFGGTVRAFDSSVVCPAAPHRPTAEPPSVAPLFANS